MSYRRKHIKPKIKKLKPRKNVFKMPFFWLALLIMIVLISAAYLILFYSRFQVTNIEISGNQKVQHNDIENLAWVDINKKLLNVGIFTISSKSIFLLNKNELVKNIVNKIPLVSDVQIEKRMPQNIILKITERQPFAVFCNSQDFQKCFFMDNHGIIFEPVQNGQQYGMVIVVKDLKGNEVFVGENIIEKNTMDTISKIQKNLSDNFQIGIKEVFVSNTLVFKTSEHWQIYFDPNSNIDFQITKMKALLQDEIPVTARKNIQYIYLQYKDRAYYK